MRVALRSIATQIILLCVVASFAAGIPAVALAQDGSAPNTLHVNARIVVLDVVVTDNEGNLVDRPLTQDDFTIVEDRQIQQIRSFEPPRFHRMPPGNKAIVKSAADLKKIGDAPVTILVLDELNSRFEDMSYSRQMMVKYLQSQPKVLEQPTVLLNAQNTSFQQLHDYTQDRDALIAAVKSHKPQYPSKMMNGNNGPGAVERMAQVMSALQQIAQASTGTPGRKNLIWVGSGFPSADLITLDTDEADRIKAAFRRVMIRLLTARITMYTINPVAGTSTTEDITSSYGLDTAMNTDSISPLEGAAVSFSALASSTGGIAFQGRNDINNVIGEGIEKGQDYYTLSYSPKNTSEDPAQYRSIRVVMKDPNMHATTRDGYYPETTADMNPVLDKTMKPKQITANLKLDLSAALTTVISYNGLHLTVDKTAAGVYTIHVGADGIGWLDGGASTPQHSEATVAAAWYDTKGKLIGHVVDEKFFERTAKSSGAMYVLPIALPKDAVRVRFVVRDAANGRMGTFDMTKF